MRKRNSGYSLTLGVILCAVAVLFAFGNSNADELQGTTSTLKQKVNVVESASMFHALDKITTENQTSITPLTDGQLASIEGEGRGPRINLQLNISVVVANNICVLCSGTSQSILAAIFQGNSN